MKPHSHRREPQGAVLITTLIVLTVLAVVAVAFMQSTSMDQLSARSSSGSYRAQLAADAGAAVARGELSRLVSRFPDSVTVWQNIGSGLASGTNNEATVLYARSNVSTPNSPARPGQFGAEVALVAFPLLSRSNSAGLPFSSLSNALPFAPTDPSMVNLNATNTSQSNAFIGERSTTNAGAPVAAAQWIYFGASPGPTNTNNPAIARYAYWIEDQSFKVNVNAGTNGQRGTSTNLGPEDLRLDGSWQSSSNAAVRSANAADVVADRGTNTNFFPTAGSAAIAAGLSTAASAAEFRFLSTAHSAGLDLSRGGFKRFNINTVTNGITGPADAANIRISLNRIIAAITNTNSVPNFGQRFYRLTNTPAGIIATNAVTAEHAAIYLNKIAANILDYLDGDDQPTIINNDATFTLRTGRPTNAIYALGGNTDGVNSVAAIGVENLPRLQEYAFHARLRSMRHDTDNPNSFGFLQKTDEGAVNPSSAEFEIWIDHYFEFWNPGTRDITLSNAFLQIDKIPAFPNSGGVLATERSITNIPVNATFPAGQITVLTTAPLTEANTGLLGANVVYLDVPEADRKFTNSTTATTNRDYFGYDRLFQVSMAAGPQTKGAVFLGNNNGLLESFVGLPVNAQANLNAVGMTLCVSNDAIRSGLSSLASGNVINARGGSLRGNSSNSVAGAPFSTEGDPRALNEQLEFRNFAATSDYDQTRFFVTITNSPSEANSTFGQPNANFVKASNWVDFSSLNAGSSTAPLFVRNGPIQSIGELGHLTDSARVPGTSGALINVTFSRGGGRTLRIGQSEHPRWYDGNQTNASRTWTSWRLADVFTTKTNVTIPGLINPNGALRDGGAALRAALYGMTYLPSPEGVPGLANLQLNPTRLNLVVSSLNAFLTNAAAAGLPSGALNALWERGEISQLPVLNTALGPLAMSNKFDRGREELVRRSIEMITTRGSVFTVYVVGQALQVTRQATNVLGSARLKQTFEISPQFATADAFDDNFNPAQAARISRRFAAPTNYTTRILQTTYD